MKNSDLRELRELTAHFLVEFDWPYIVAHDIEECKAIGEELRMSGFIVKTVDQVTLRVLDRAKHERG